MRLLKGRQRMPRAVATDKPWRHCLDRGPPFQSTASKRDERFYVQ